MYKAEFIDWGKRNSGVSTDDKRWVITHNGTIVSIVENYFQNPEGVAKGIAESLNTNTRIKLDLAI